MKILEQGSLIELTVKRRNPINWVQRIGHLRHLVTHPFLPVAFSSVQVTDVCCNHFPGVIQVLMGVVQIQDSGFVLDNGLVQRQGVVFQLGISLRG